MGSAAKKASDAEKPALLKMGKKLVAARDLPVGHVLTEKDVAIKSPGDGLRPYRLAELLGRRLDVPLDVDADLSFDVLV